MYIKEKLHKILNRLKSVLTGDVKQTYSSEYANGFEHAVILFHVAFQNEFSTYIQIETNKHQEIRDLQCQVEKLKMSLGNRARYVEKLEIMAKQKEPAKLSNTKKKKIYRAIEEMTGQPYEYIKEQFIELVEGKGVKND